MGWSWLLRFYKKVPRLQREMLPSFLIFPLFLPFPTDVFWGLPAASHLPGTEPFMANT